MAPTVAFVSTARDHRREQMRVADAATGVIREVMEEKAETFFESGNGAVNWRYLPASNEVIWFSERDNWGHLYLHDLKTGREKNPITTGNGNVTQLLRVDEKNRQLYFVAVGREQGRDPYFRHLYRINMDGKSLQLLTPEDADHDVSLSPSGRFFVDTWSKPDVPPTSQVRDADGKLVMALEKADISQAGRGRLEAAGADHGEGARRRHRSLRPDVQADESRSGEEIPDRQPHLSRSPDRKRRRPHLQPVARRRAGARRARLRRRRDRRDGHAVAIQEVSRGLLRQHGGQHAARSGRGDEGAGVAISVDRHRSRRHLRPFRRRLRDRRRDVSLSRISSRSGSRRRATTTTACTRTTGPRSGRGCSRRRATAPRTTTTRRIS